MSPKTDPLPIMEGGLVWDGITEYQNIPPVGVPVVWLCRMYGDGTRRFSEALGSAAPMGQLRIQTSRGWEVIGIANQTPASGGIDYRNVGFLAYDGTFTFDPVNQFFC